MSIQCSICLGSSSVSSETSPLASTFCGHVFHHTCLTTWLVVSKSRKVLPIVSAALSHFQNGRDCPECRQRLSQSKVFRLYLKRDAQGVADTSISESATDYADQWIQKCQGKTLECEQKQRELDEMKLSLDREQERTKALFENCEKIKLDRDSAKERVKYLAEFKREYERMQGETEKFRKEIKTWKEEAEKLQRIKCVITGDIIDVKKMLLDVHNGYDSPAVRESLAVCVEALKNELEKLKAHNSSLREETEKWKSTEHRYKEQSSRLRAQAEQFRTEGAEKDDRIRRLEAKLMTLGKVLKGRSEVPQTQVKRFIHESPAPQGLFTVDQDTENYVTPLKNPEEKRSASFPVAVSTSRQPILGEPSTFLTPKVHESEDRPLHAGKSVCSRKEGETKRPKISKSIFGEGLLESPVTPVDSNIVVPNVKRNPFRKITVKPRRNDFAAKFAPVPAVIALDDSD